MVMNIQEVEARTMPVLVLADTSGSMSVGGKIDVLNDAIERMIGTLRQVEVPDCEIAVAVIAFGEETARLHLPLTSVSELAWQPLSASGRTPMGQAFEFARSLLEDRSVVPSRSYRPNLVLVSDGIPTDDWETPLRKLDEAEQAKRALRFAVGIGADMKPDVLRSFAGDLGEVVPVDEVEMLIEFFKFVTYTVATSVHQPAQSQAELPTFKDYPSDDVLEF